MASKRTRRRQKQLRHARAATERQRRDQRRVIHEMAEAAVALFAEVLDAVADERISPTELVEGLDRLLEGELTGELLAHPDFAMQRGVHLAERVGEGRARSIATELALAGADNPRLAWMATGLYSKLDDIDEAERVAAHAMARLTDPLEGAVATGIVADLQLRSGRMGDALALLDSRCARSPEDRHLQTLRARVLTHTVNLSSGSHDEPQDLDEGMESWAVPAAEQLEASQAALARFADRFPLYELREAVEAFIATESDLSQWQSDEIGRFLESAREAADLGPLDQLDSSPLRLASGADGAIEAAIDGRPGDAIIGLARLAAEQSWVSGPQPSGDQDLPDNRTVLGRFASEPSTPGHLADAAWMWLRHVRYGLWQPSLAEVGESPPGVWLTDLVTRQAFYAAVPAEQLEGLARWSVLAGPLVPVGGVWRTGATVIVIEPRLADRATDAILQMADQVVTEVAREHGIRSPKPKHRDPSRITPHGVLAGLAEPMEDVQADVTAKVVGVALPHLVGLIEAANRKAPGISNTDGEPITLLRATLPATDPVAVRRRFLTDPDFESEDDDWQEEGEVAPPVRWLGREMTPTEASASMAQYRAEARKRGLRIEVPEGPRRWLRGTIHFEVGQVRVEVNSRQRLDSVSAKLRRAGAGEPRVESLVDPTQDLPLPGGRLRGGRAASDPEVEAAWQAHWLDERVPALNGATPESAASDASGRVLLESLLRQFEHDADLALAEGDKPTDVGQLRRALGMQDGVFSLAHDGEKGEADDSGEAEE